MSIGNDFFVTSKKALIRELTSQRQKILDDLKGTENSILLTIEASRTAIHKTLLDAHEASARVVADLHSKETALWRSLQAREQALFALHLGYGEAMQAAAGLLKEKELALGEEQHSLTLRRKQLERWAALVQQQLLAKEEDLTALQRTLDEDVALLAEARKKEEEKRKADRHDFAKLRRVLNSYEKNIPSLRGGSVMCSKRGIDQLVVVEAEPTTLRFQVVIGSRRPPDSSANLHSNPNSDDGDEVGAKYFPNVYASATFLEAPAGSPSPDIPPAKVSADSMVTFEHVILSKGAYTLEVSLPRVTAGTTRPLTLSVAVVPEEMMRFRMDPLLEGQQQRWEAESDVISIPGTVFPAVPLSRVTLWMPSTPDGAPHQLSSVVEIDFCGTKGSRDFVLQLPNNSVLSSGALVDVFFTLHSFPSRLMRSQFRLSIESSDKNVSLSFIKNVHLVRDELTPVSVDHVILPDCFDANRGSLLPLLSPCARLVAAPQSSNNSSATVLVSKWNGNLRQPHWSPTSSLSCSGTVSRISWSSDSRWLLCATRESARSSICLFDCVNLGEVHGSLTTTSVLSLPLGMTAADITAMDCLDRTIAVLAADGAAHILADRLSAPSVANGNGFVELCSDAMAVVLYDAGRGGNRCTVVRRGAVVTSFSAADGKVAATAQLSAVGTVCNIKVAVSPLGLQLHLNGKSLVCLHAVSLAVLDSRFVRATEAVLTSSGSVLAVELQTSKEGPVGMLASSRVSEFWFLSTKKLELSPAKSLVHSVAIPYSGEVGLLFASSTGKLELAKVQCVA
jgi:hypothetical protein